MSAEQATPGELYRWIVETRDTCARRAERHVDVTLYSSERDALRRELETVAREHAALKQRHDDDMKALDQQRRKVWLAVGTAFVGPVLSAVFLFFLLEVGIA